MQLMKNAIHIQFVISSLLYQELMFVYINKKSEFWSKYIYRCYLIECFKNVCFIQVTDNQELLCL